MFCFIWNRETLNQEVENLRDEQRYLNLDISNLQTRWHSVREEKLKATNILNKIRKTEEELVRLAEENEQLDLDEKVGFVSFSCNIAIFSRVLASGLCLVFL